MRFPRKPRKRSTELWTPDVDWSRSEPLPAHSGIWPATSIQRRESSGWPGGGRFIYLSRIPVPHRQCSADKLSSSEVQPSYAGMRLRGIRTRDAGLPARSRTKVQVLFVRGLHVHRVNVGAGVGARALCSRRYILIHASGVIMQTPVVSKQVSIEDFVSELRKFPEPAFDRTDAILKFLASTSGACPIRLLLI